MGKATAWTLHAAMSAMAATGLWMAWLVLFAASPPETELEVFVAEDRWQSWLTAIHIVVAPVLVFAVAFIWHEHVWPRIRFPNAQRRQSGILLLILFGPLVLGGYLLQVAEGEGLRTALSWIHAVAGALFAAGYAVHLALRPPRDGADANEAAES